MDKGKTKTEQNHQVPTALQLFCFVLFQQIHLFSEPQISLFPTS